MRSPGRSQQRAPSLSTAAFVSSASLCSCGKEEPSQRPHPSRANRTATARPNAGVATGYEGCLDKRQLTRASVVGRVAATAVPRPIRSLSRPGWDWCCLGKGGLGRCLGVFILLIGWGLRPGEFICVQFLSEGRTPAKDLCRQVAHAPDHDRRREGCGWAQSRPWRYSSSSSATAKPG